MSVFVVSTNGKPLMPTTEYRARKLLKSGKAVIFSHRPFAIKLTRTISENVQPVEYCCDTGYKHIGVSIKSEKHEYVSAQFDMLPNEKKRHDARRKYRRARRNRLRCRAPRFNNRRASKKEGWLAPSLRNIRDQHVRIFEKYKKVAPITKATFEMGTFDTAAMHEFEATGTVLCGEDYQKGPRYGMDTMRKAVFFRDGYECQICGAKAEDGAILRVHHIGFRTGDHSNRMSNLLTVCTKCHTAANHNPGGKLYDITPKTKPLSGAAFMNSVRKQMWNTLKTRNPDVEFHMGYGASTQEKRKALALEKSHVNDAYAMGSFHPKHRAHSVRFKKLRRNNRILEKFYDAKYEDKRDGEKKSGSALSCGRTKRSESRRSEKNLRGFRGKKISSGRRSIRRQHYSFHPYDKVMYMGHIYSIIGIQQYGTYVVLENKKSVSTKKVSIVKHANGYANIPFD